MPVHRLLPKTTKNVVLFINSDAPMTTGITWAFYGHIISSLILILFS